MTVTTLTLPLNFQMLPKLMETKQANAADGLTTALLAFGPASSL